MVCQVSGRVSVRGGFGFGARWQADLPQSVRYKVAATFKPFTFAVRKVASVLTITIIIGQFTK